MSQGDLRFNAHQCIRSILESPYPSEADKQKAEILMTHFVRATQRNKRQAQALTEFKQMVQTRNGIIKKLESELQELDPCRGL